MRTAQDRRWPQATSSTPTMETETRDGERARTSANVGLEGREDTAPGTQSGFLPLPPAHTRQLAPSGVPKAPARERPPLPHGAGAPRPLPAAAGGLGKLGGTLRRLSGKTKEAWGVPWGEPTISQAGSS